MVASSPLNRGQQRPHPSATTEQVRALLTAEEWRLVEKHRGPVKRVRKLLRIAETRLQQAQLLIAQQEVAQATTKVAQYTIIISYSLTFIEGLPSKHRKKRRNAYKEFDVRVREQLYLLQQLKREFPVNNETIDEALFTAERLRIIALNRFSGAEIIKVPEKHP